MDWDDYSDMSADDLRELADGLPELLEQMGVEACIRHLEGLDLEERRQALHAKIDAAIRLDLLLN